MAQSVLGIDVAKIKLDVVLLDNDRKLYRQFENTLSGYCQMKQWLIKQDANQAHVCLEATGQYGDGIAEYLFAHNYPVSVVNPARIKHYGNCKLRRNKTDKADALLIAEYCLVENPALWTPPPASFKNLQALVRHLDDLQSSRQREANRFGSGVKNTFVMDQLNSLIAMLDIQIRETKLAIQNLIDQDPYLRHSQDLLVSIKGIGRLTAAKILGEVRNILDFDDARQLAAYAGLTPRNFISGSSVHKKARLSKTGNSNLRKILYLPAISAKRWNPIINQFCSRLALNGLTPMEVIGAAMHKLLRIIYGVLKSGRPFDSNYLRLSFLPS